MARSRHYDERIERMKAVKIVKTLVAIAIACSLGMIPGGISSRSVSAEEPRTERVETAVRIDNVPLDQLDQLLKSHGIKEVVRKEIIEFEKADREAKEGNQKLERKSGKGKRNQPQPRTPDVVKSKGVGFWYPCVCPEGFGAVAIWKGAGHIYSHFLIWPNTATPWSAGGFCPDWTMCTIVSTISSGPGRTVAFQGYTSILTPIYISARCSDPEWG